MFDSKELATIENIFDKSRKVFGVYVFGTSNVDDSKFDHAANVLRGYLDKDGDGKADSEKLVENLEREKAALFIFFDEDEFDEYERNYDDKFVSTGVNFVDVFDSEIEDSEHYEDKIVSTGANFIIVFDSEIDYSEEYDNWFEDHYTDYLIDFGIPDLDEAPKDIDLSTYAFNENITPGTAVATLDADAIGLDSDDSFTYALVAGAGDDDNAAFSIDGNQLKIKASPDYESQSSYTIRLQAKGLGGSTLEEVETLYVANLNALDLIFSKNEKVFGVNVFGTDIVEDSKFDHAVNVLRGYLDNDGDGKADSKKLVESLNRERAAMVITGSQSELRGLDKLDIIREVVNFQDLYNNEIRPPEDTSGKFDATLEEVFHLISDYGYSKIYPEQFGRDKNSVIGQLMNGARGGYFEIVPRQYPDGAYYTYYDSTCSYECQITEYFYWGMTSVLGGQQAAGRLEEIQDEWRLNTPEKVAERDPELFDLLTNGQFDLPTVLPGRIKISGNNAVLIDTRKVADPNETEGLRKSAIELSPVAIDFELDLDRDINDATTTIPLDLLLGDLEITGADGKRDPNKNLIYFSIDTSGSISPLSYDALQEGGARFYDSNGDGVADLLSLKLVDGGIGDKDGVKNGVIVDPSALGTVSLDPIISQLNSGFIQVSDAANSSPASFALQSSLTSRAITATEIGYVILNDGESATVVDDFKTFKARAKTLFSSLESDDIVLEGTMQFEREFLLRNGQNLRFFAVSDATIDDLSGLDDSRLSFFDSSIDSLTGQASFSNANGVAFGLSLLGGDQDLRALIAQEQTVAPLLDFTAFTNNETVSGSIVQSREADYDAITGFYRVLDTSGSVRAADGSLLTPGDAGYAAAALRDANQVATFSDLSVADGQSTSTDFSLQDSGTFAPFAQVNGHTFFAFSEANADGLAHFRSLGTNLFGLEDRLGGGDLDFDDHIIGFNISGLTRSDQAAVA